MYEPTQRPRTTAATDAITQDGTEQAASNRHKTRASPLERPSYDRATSTVAPTHQGTYTHQVSRRSEEVKFPPFLAQFMGAHTGSRTAPRAPPRSRQDSVRALARTHASCSPDCSTIAAPPEMRISMRFPATTRQIAPRARSTRRQPAQFRTYARVHGPHPPTDSRRAPRRFRKCRCRTHPRRDAAVAGQPRRARPQPRERTCVGSSQTPRDARHSRRRWRAPRKQQQKAEFCTQRPRRGPACAATRRAATRARNAPPRPREWRDDPGGSESHRMGQSSTAAHRLMRRATPARPAVVGLGQGGEH